MKKKWNGMERKFRYGIWKMPEWNGRFQEWNGKQSFIPITHSILDFAHGIYRKINMDRDN